MEASKLIEVFREFYTTCCLVLKRSVAAFHIYLIDLPADEINSTTIGVSKILARLRGGDRKL